ncbi:Serpin (serine protease inhibitor) (plasmid) [Tautonia plasticadhaerens]|uniref:Serpin (Serine protease inhibitor) n=1 Tax=Tautonia plasticadhaerens TaxID=2527974 RepID=A0A518HEK2_9BACT|nr:Serpin (serine protease inhibitor) [Tautonia plasticadhaerens]
MIGVLLLATKLAGEPGDEVVRGNTRFALDLYGKLREEPGNLFCSPFSISTGLAMTYAGAGG